MERTAIEQEEISQQYLGLVYGRGHFSPKPARARALRQQYPWLSRRHPWAEGRLSATPPPWGMHPLIALTHSCFATSAKKQFERSVRQVLAAGADPNQSWTNPEGHPLTALYGATRQGQLELATLLIESGANPNDNESLYHAVDHPECIKLLLKAGAKPAGSNALAHSLDSADRLESTRLLLKHGASPAEGPGGGALFWAIRRRSPLGHIKLLLAHRADPHAAFHGITTYQAALWMGLPDVGAHLRRVTRHAKLTGRDAFLAACACGDEYQARAELKREPRLVQQLPANLLGLLPLQVAAGNAKGAQLMVKLGWPVTVRGGDWKATPLNLAVFRGDAKMTRFLLENGASWEEQHGYGDNVRGTLHYASHEEPTKGGDWRACARILEEYGMPPLHSTR